MENRDNLASYYFHQGTNFHAYEYLGCNLTKKGSKYVYSFRTWAPSADSVAIVSDFFGWNSPVNMERISEKGIWEYVYTSEVSLEKQAYKYRIEKNGVTRLKGDPYARFSRGGADGASLVYAESEFKFSDKGWMNHRKKTVRADEGVFLSAPLNIYEIHLGSFIRHKEDNRYYTYRELSEILPGYLKYMGYTHVEFLPPAEHPFDGSWGYQVCGFYAPTSRFGEPNDFKHLINTLHKSGIGVIIDWVPAHFPKDEWGLYEFDGSPLYEYQGKDRKESETWGTRFFDLGREEVQSFLISNALYYFREFHVDGLRVDAVASMLYLDYDKRPDEWVPNQYGGKENLEAIAFFKKLNTAIFAEFADVLMIAEESGSFNGITRPVYKGGLGFNLKWNMGFANDFYDYIMTDPIYRKYKHKALNFPLMYAFSENYVLPISHDEVVHGKLSYINKMHGEYEDKFRQMRESLLLFATYPGKKLTFMGTEYGQFREWDYENSLEWFMLDYDKHRALREYTASLNRFYLKHSELWDYDFDPKGFEWILADESEKNTVAYKRKNKDGDELTVLINFSGASQKINIDLSEGKFLECLFESEKSPLSDEPVYVCGKETEIILPPFYGGIFKLKSYKRKIKI